MHPGPAESDFGLQGRIDTLGLKEIFLNFQCIYWFYKVLLSYNT